MTAQETPNKDFQISHTNNNFGYITDVEVTMDHIYLSMQNGERIKISPADANILWAITYGERGFAIALSPDQTYLLANSYFSTSLHLGKLSSSDGSVLAS